MSQNHTPQTLKKRKTSASSSATLQQPKRLAREDSVLAEAASSKLRLNSSSSYSLVDLPSSASKFKERDTKALNITFSGASGENDVIPNVEVTTIPREYILDGINRSLLRSPDFNVDNLEGVSDDAKTFIDITENSLEAVGTSETYTDSLVDDLLRVVKLNTWPLKIQNHPPCKLVIENEPRVSSDPVFVVRKRGQTFEKSQKARQGTKIGETQIAIEILACGSENVHSLETEGYIDQTLWAIRVISTYVTFYKTQIPAMYWTELDYGLPQEQSIEIQRWPPDNGLTAGFDLSEPDGRRTVLTALTKICGSLLREDA